MKFINSDLIMDKERFQTLLEKYYQGESTLEEDKSLEQYLTSDTSSDNASEKAQFRFYREQAKLVPRPDFKIKLEKPKPKVATFFTPFRIAATVTIMMSIGYYLFVRNVKSFIEERTIQTETRALTLADGTKIWLGSESKVKYPKVFDKMIREVHLEGEAYFEVTENKKQPFIVSTNHSVSRVVGTSFNLRSYPNEAKEELTVLTGEVKFGIKQEPIFPGTKATLDHDSQLMVKEPTQGTNILAWKNKELRFENTSLKNAFLDIERYFGIKIKFEGRDLENCHFTGTFQNPEVNSVLEAIAYSVNLKYERANEGYSFSGNGCGQ
jgi:transmembrane sensor